ncbi:uncharacterized protein TNCV_1511611 [Trichonephila clavipes]|nr:uncharacterized protein TNCV_1511611 [Trichonephila clavipes]
MSLFENGAGRDDCLERIYSSLMTIKPTSVESERAFPSEGHFVTKIRIRLKDEKLDELPEWYGHRIVAGFVTSSSPVPLKTRRVGQRCTLNLSRAEMSSRWCGVVVRRGGASSGVVHVT